MRFFGVAHDLRASGALEGLRASGAMIDQDARGHALEVDGVAAPVKQLRGADPARDQRQ
jgi:hypothetical protein